MPERKRQIAVLGAGAWGTVLANLAARHAATVTLWARDADHAAEMAATGVNASRLPGVPLGANVAPSNSLSEVAKADVIFLAVPAQALRQACEALARFAPRDVPIVVCAKGIERETGRFPESDRGRNPAGKSARRSLRAELCGRCRQGPADGRHARRR